VRVILVVRTICDVFRGRPRDADLIAQDEITDPNGQRSTENHGVQVFVNVSLVYYGFVRRYPESVLPVRVLQTLRVNLHQGSGHFSLIVGYSGGEGCGAKRNGGGDRVVEGVLQHVDSPVSVMPILYITFDLSGSDS